MQDTVTLNLAAVGQIQLIDLNLEPEVIIVENYRKTSVTISTNFISNQHAFVHHISQFLQQSLIHQNVVFNRNLI